MCLPRANSIVSWRGKANDRDAGLHRHAGVLSGFVWMARTIANRAVAHKGWDCGA